jgi:hypothetical protein
LAVRQRSGAPFEKHRLDLHQPLFFTGDTSAIWSTRVRVSPSCADDLHVAHAAQIAENDGTSRCTDVVALGFAMAAEISPNLTENVPPNPHTLAIRHLGDAKAWYQPDRERGWLHSQFTQAAHKS